MGGRKQKQIGKKVNLDDRPADGPSVFRCNFDGCHQTFPTEGQLKTHKNVDPNHEYCEPCNLNFDDYSDLIQHRYADPAHQNDKLKICPICGAEFHSDGVRRKHVERQHPVRHNVVCYGCHQSFSQPSEYVRHIEREQCPVLSKSQLQSRIQHKTAVKALLDKSAGSSHNFNGVAVAGSTIGCPESLTGIADMPIPDVEYPDEQADVRDRKPGGGRKKGRAPSPSSFSPADLSGGFVKVEEWAEQADFSAPPQPSSSEIGDMSTAPSSWPSLVENRNKPMTVVVPTATKDAYPAVGTAKSTMARPENSSASSELSSSREESSSVWKSVATSATSVTDGLSFKWAEPATTASTIRTGGSVSGRVEKDEITQFHLSFWDPNHPDFNVDRLYRHSDHTYVCPHPDCSLQTNEPGYMKSHLVSYHISQIPTRCPECRRRFASLESLVAHVTSLSRKCKIKQRRSYQEKLSVITGGFIDTRTGIRENAEWRGPIEMFESKKPAEIESELASRVGAIRIGRTF